ncbi:uncharacterized protein F54H12.2-like [Amia ocellicauda]|uniref:uncharacterized protein F54H12.2-like n=1 Tax=Amia ocellicauda TaxID=2972642 RepID=UPI003463F7EA
MAFVHCSPGECTKSELDLFQLAPTQTSFEKSIYVEVLPLTALSDNAPLEFYITGNGEDYLDLNNTVIYLTCKITKHDGTDLALDDRVGLDTDGQHEVTVLNGANLGFKNRAAYTAGSRKLELLGCIHADMLFQDKLMLNGVDIKIKLTRNREAFCLMSNAEDFKLSVLSAALFVKRVQVAPAVRLGHADALQVANAKYPVDRVQIKVFSLARGSRVCNQENLFLGQLPKIIVIGFVDNASFSGDVTQNPFNFKHCDINFLALYADGEQIPTKPLQPNFANNNSVREYFNLVETAGKRLKDKPLVVDRKEFARGYTLFTFNLSPDQECTGHYSLIKTGNLRAEISFAQPLPTTVNMIVYAVFDNIVEINMRCQILYDYS